MNIVALGPFLVLLDSLKLFAQSGTQQKFQGVPPETFRSTQQKFQVFLINDFRSWAVVLFLACSKLRFPFSAAQVLGGVLEGFWYSFGGFLGSMLIRKDKDFRGTLSTT